MLNERNQRGYYRCKHKHPKTYELICNTYQKYITDEHLKMLHHPWTNEALNRCVSAYAPKDRTYSKTESLKTRVDIAAAIHNVGHENFSTLTITSSDSYVLLTFENKNRSSGQLRRRVNREGVSRGVRNVPPLSNRTFVTTGRGWNMNPV